MTAARWHPVCTLEDIYPDSGVCALVEGRQIALFRFGNALHAISNYDPISETNVLCRGIVGALTGEPVVASPMYKQHFSLVTGRCLEDAAVSVPVYAVRVSDGRIWLRAAPTITARATQRRLVVIGNGPAAMRTLEELIELAPGSYQITVFGGEARDTYNRVMLSSVLSGERSTEQLISHPAEWFEENDISLHAADPVVRIDRVRRRIHSSRGVELPYDRLLVATGSVPKTLDVPGHTLPGVMTLRDWQDVDRLFASARSAHRALIIGGGVLGLEAASGLARLGLQVSVVHDVEVLMNRQLDAAAGALLRQQLEESGIQVLLSAQAVEFQGVDSVAGVRLADDRVLAADLVVVAIGVRPNVALAQAAGLRCEDGVLVDDTMLTFDPVVYAVGECVQHRGSTYGVVAPLWEQARVCAAHLAERGVCRYRGSRQSTRLRVGGIDVFAAGERTNAPGLESLVLRDPRRRVYRRLVIENDRVRGALLYGDTRDSSWYLELIRQERPIGALRDRLMFGNQAGEPLEPVV